MTWKIVSNQHDKKRLLLEESLFALGNGYLGVRGNLEEASNELCQIRGTYINGFYDDVEIPYAEKGYGYPETSQKMLNLIDAQTLKIFLGEELITIFNGDVKDYQRILNIKKGYLARRFHYTTPLGKEVVITFKRLVSFTYQSLFCQEVEVKPLNYFGPIKIISELNGDVENYVDKSDPRVAQGHSKRLLINCQRQFADFEVLESITEQSKLRVLVLSQTSIDHKHQKQVKFTDKRFISEIRSTLDQKITITKYNLYYDSIRYGVNLLNKAIADFKIIKKLKFNQLIASQESYLNDYFSLCDIKITGNADLQIGIRFNLFHLIQGVGKDQFSNIAAKGLSGEGYEGHYFWDTEIFIFPVFLLTKPDLARNLLLYRYHTLDYARKRARELGHKKGAAFPWRTIKGTECSSFFPASSAQYHINADISYSIIQYYLVTKDDDFLLNYGAEIIFETARLFIDIGHYLENGFNIYGVTGPDEYTAIVNNNYYTNVMAKYNLHWAVKTYQILLEKQGKKFTKLLEKLELTSTEIAEFKKASKNMYLPYDKALDINPQDDSFLGKPTWDFANTPENKYPLLLNYHLLTIYRHQVCKQADTVLAHFLLEDEIDISTIRNSYNYYETVTTHDSSLSSCIFSIMAMKIGEIDKAYEYFSETARMDLDNTHKNTKDGLHMANMGGTHMAIVYGFAGLRIKEATISIAPKIPKQIESYSFIINYQKRLIKIFKNQATCKLELLSGEEIKIIVDGKYLLLKKNQ